MSEPSSTVRLRALVVDDEKNIRATLGMCLSAIGCEVSEAASGAEALRQVQRKGFDIAFIDLRLGNEDGLKVLTDVLAERPALHVVIVTAYATVDTAVQALKLGARDYLQKPFTPAQIRHVVERVVERLAMANRLTQLESQVQDVVPDVELHTASPRMQELLRVLEKAAASDVPVLFRGESGTGKSMLARVVHARSARRERPFVTINCPTLSEELLASELFGHARGAFTGAVKDQPGRVETADGGTLFLDEIGEIPASLQAKLLRFVQDHEFERVGEGRTRHADVRILAATNRDLEADVRSGRFREDLLYRLNVVEVLVPPLRERPEDILPIARTLLNFLSRSSPRGRHSLSPDAESAIQRYPWPGNIRELRNALERAIVLADSTLLQPRDLPSRLGSAKAAGPSLGGDCTVEEITDAHIKAVVERAPTQEEAARILGLDVSTLWRRRKRR